MPVVPAESPPTGRRATRARWALCALAGLLLPPGPAAPADRNPTTDLTWNTDGPARLGRAIRVPLSRAAPEAVTPPPDAGEAYYGFVGLGTAADVLVCVDLAPGRERLWVDGGGDRSLGDDPPRRLALTAPWSATETVPTRAAPGESEQRVDDEVEVTFTLHWAARDGDPPYLEARPRRQLAGRIELGGRLRDVAVVDADGDLHFDERGRDLVVLDVDGDGDLADGPRSHESVPLGEPIRVGDGGFVAVLTLLDAGGGPDAPAARIEFLPMSDLPPRPAAGARDLAPPSGGYPPVPTEPLESILERLTGKESLPTPLLLSLVSATGRHGSDRAFGALTDLLSRSRAGDVREAAVLAMGNPRMGVVAAEFLTGLALGDDPPLAVAGIRALHAMDHPDRERTYRLVVARKTAPARPVAARFLAYVPAATARRAVEQILMGEFPAAVRLGAYLGARSYPDGPPEDAVQRSALDKDPMLLAAAIRDLHAAADPAARRLADEAATFNLDDPGDRLRRAVVDVLGAAGDARAVETLVTLLRHPRLRDRIVSRLGDSWRRETVEALSAYLDLPRPSLRMLSVESLGRILLPQSTDLLVGRIREEKDGEVLEALYEALATHGTTRAVAALLGAAKDAPQERRAALMRAMARLGDEHPRVRRYVAGLLGARDWEERLLAIEAAAASGERAFAAEIAPSLRHRRWQVRLVAAEALERLGAPEPLDALIAALADEDHRRNRQAMAAALVAITGVNYYDDASLWKKWREAGGEPGEKPGGRAPAPGTTTEAPRGRFYGITVNSNHVVFALDRSGSMAWVDPVGQVGGAGRSKLDTAAEELVSAVSRLPDKAMVNAVVFDDGVNAWSPGLRKLSAGPRASLYTYARTRMPGGGTNIYDALARAMDDPHADTVFLLSDGNATTGKYVRTGEILTRVRRMNVTRKLTIHCISVGRHSTLLRGLAEESGGQYVRH